MSSKIGKKEVIASSTPRWLVLTGILVVFLIVANIVLAFMQPSDRINGELWLINRVISGQTVEASVLNNPNMTVQRVRLLGLSAPLKEQAPWGDRARQRLSDLVKEQKVILEFDVKQKDNSDRLLAYIWKDKLLVNQYLVGEGLAIADPYPPNSKYDARISRAQSKARLQELGIWDTQNPLRLSPRDFRRQLSN
ncbi:thermonuclease family protein [Pseudanabaena sp. 'Roaring Creek']|uniref:thermonuclease family protein n=1 Tax=Pseudanabaena sp. 'Roaring Creek' TaxID=1681830 RepID=UPI0006D7CA15|nr:thermonuclease family protein [Pseudanabaena sp. 'Roaring Creek']